MKTRTLSLGLFLCVGLPTVGLPTQASAAYNCGRFMCSVFGIQCVTKQHNLQLALEWPKVFRHTSAHAGAVVVQTRPGRALGGGRGGHVSKIIAMKSPCRATVRDNRGTYERNICQRLVAYVQP